MFKGAVLRYLISDALSLLGKSIAGVVLPLAHLYSDGELAEIERIFRAIPERGLIDEYLRVSHLIDTLPGNASAEERERAINAGMAFLDKIADCLDASNWLRPDKDYERMLENMAMVHYNDAQIAVSDELFLRFTDRLAQRNV